MVKALKSYNHLFEKLLSDELIEKAIQKASKGKKDRPRVKKYLERPDLVEYIKDYVFNYKNAPHKPIEIYDGIKRKKRTIIVPTFKSLWTLILPSNISINDLVIVRPKPDPSISFCLSLVIVYSS